MKHIFFILIFFPSVVFAQKKPSQSEIDGFKQIVKNGYNTGYSDEIISRWTERMIPEFASWYANASLEERKLFKKANGESPVFARILKECLTATLAEVSAINKSGSKKIEVFDKDFLKSAMRKKIGDTASKNMDVEAAIDCIYDKIKYTVPGEKEFGSVGDPNSVFAKTIMVPCVQATLKLKANPVLKNIIGGVDGPSGITRIPTVDMGNLQTIGLKINNKPHYFIIDSGASYVIISQDEEREFILDGLVNKQSYLSSVDIKVADGRTVTARRFILESMMLDKFTVGNVEVCVVPGASLLLLGRSFLDRFKSWSLDNTTREFVLEK